MSLSIGVLVTGAAPAFIFIRSVTRKKRPHNQFSFKRVVITGQFLIGISLLICVILVHKQLNELRKVETGIDIQDKIVLQAPTGTDFKATSPERFKESVRAIPGVKHVTATTDIPGQYMKMGWMIDRTDVDPQVNEVIDGARIDYDFADVFRLKLLEGNSFSPSENNTRNLIINETACARLRFSSPQEAIGKQVILPEIRNSAFTIQGVIKDFHQLSPEKEFSAFLLFCADESYSGYNYYVIDLEKGNGGAAPGRLKPVWESMYPNSSFDYFFLNEFYGRQYVSTAHFGNLLSALSFIAIFLSVLGLFGLINFAINKRVKEIGIRKINGAKISGIILLFNREIVGSIVTAFIISIPVSSFIMHKWLENFAHKTSMSWWIFALAGALVLVIALLTVSWQSWKAAARNPVEALRYE